MAKVKVITVAAGSSNSSSFNDQPGTGKISKLFIKNQGGGTVYLHGSADTSPSATNGFPLDPGQMVVFEVHNDDEVYASGGKYDSQVASLQESPRNI